MEEAAARLAAESPGVHQGDMLRLARRSVAANLRLVADLLRGDVELDAVEPPVAAVVYCRELARRNVPMTELARAYRVGQHAVWRFGVARLRELLGDGQDATVAIERFTDSTFAAGEVLMGRALERYADERDRWVRSADAVRRATVQAVLSGEPLDVAAASARIRYDLGGRHQAFIVWAEDSSGLEARAAATGGRGALIVGLGDGMLAGWCVPEALQRGASGAGQVAHGTPGSGVGGFRASHHQAAEARRVAQLASLAADVGYPEIALVALLTADLEQAEQFARQELGALAEPEAEWLAETLLAVLEHHGSPKRAGQLLGLHENTVGKRLRTAAELLGRSTAERPAETLAALLILRARRGRL